MSTELVTAKEMVDVLLIEGRRRRVTLGLIFAVIALAALAVGSFWPKKYVSSTTILVEESNIVKPLMEGMAVATGVADRAAIAREVIFSRKIMDDILTTGGWMASNPSPVEQERLIEGIKSRTFINSLRENLIQIDYADSDPDRTYKIDTRLAELFIKESLATKERESREAYEFIDSQAEQYHAKLLDAEGKLRLFRAKDPDALPGSATDSNSRISSLSSQVENARIEAMSLRAQEGSLNSQLSGESQVVATQTREGQYHMQLAQLQGDLDKLQLTYTDAHPDVIRIRHQMEDVRAALKREEDASALRKASGISVAGTEAAMTNPLYMDLRGKLGDVQRAANAAQSRMGASQSLLNAELERSRRIADSASGLAELTRDYEVNRDIYQNLLKRRENARVSMNLDADHQGLTFTIQEPALKPLQPVGLRFMHFGLAGLAGGLALPLALLFVLARFDTRARSAEQIERLTGVPVLATIPSYATAAGRTRSRAKTLMLILIVLAVLAAYAFAFLMHLRLT